MTADSSTRLVQDAVAIWRAAVEAVDSRLLVRRHVTRQNNVLVVDQHHLAVGKSGRLLVVGAGKAAVGMAEGLLEAIHQAGPAPFPITGWLNVPDNCVRALPGIEVHAARPAKFNEPTPDGVRGSEAILRLVQEASPADGCICLLSGGASALLPAPVPEVPLEEKLQLTRYLSAQGANIQQLNTVRKHLSRIKGGRLAAACRAGWLVTLIISDVLGDPLDVIGSGPTVPDSSTPAEALAILGAFQAAAIAPSAWRYVQRAAQQGQPAPAPTCRTLHVVIGNNATAVEAAGQEAIRRGYDVAMVASSTPEGPAESVGSHLAKMAQRMRREPGPNCLISGGEPVVKLAPVDKRGLGGRNQQLVLAALCQLWGILPAEYQGSAAGANPSNSGVRDLPHPAPPDPDACRGIVVLSGGTDGEDGPTDAAGAWIDQQICRQAHERNLDPLDYLQRNDAYHFFQAVGSLLRTGPTHTNVCDVRVVLAERQQTH